MVQTINVILMSTTGPGKNKLTQSTTNQQLKQLIYDHNFGTTVSLLLHRMRRILE